MFQFLIDFNWSKLKIDWTKLLGRCYYLFGAMFWWIVDLFVFVIFGVSFKTLLVAIPLGLITALATINWLRTLVFVTRCKLTIGKLEDLFDRSNALQGVPGCGKTSTINQSGYLMALKQWKTLQHEYWQCMHMPFDSLPQKLKSKYKEVIKAYNFYKKNEDKNIPCLHSFITIEVNGRKSHDLTKNNLLQVDPLPYRSVWVCDEISNMFPNSVKGETKKQNQKLAEMCRWIRHFTDSFAFFADIRFGDAFLAIRSGCGCVLSLTQKQKWKLKPRLLCFIRDLIYSLIDFDFSVQRFLKPKSASFNFYSFKLKKSSKRWGTFVAWLNRLINCVGYREYYYSKQGCQEQGNDVETQVKSGRYWFKSCLDVKYNDRAFKNLYSCADKAFKAPANQSLDMSKEELEQMLGRNKE